LIKFVDFFKVLSDSEVVYSIFNSADSAGAGSIRRSYGNFDQLLSETTPPS